MMQQEIQNILETFEPLISIYQDGEQKIICFDSNFRNDLNREAKTKTVSTGDKNISFKVTGAERNLFRRDANCRDRHTD